MDRQPQIEPASWNAHRGNVWAELQPLLDRMFLPFEGWIADCVADQDARDVLDVGCGAGASSLAIARALAPDGHCTGIDIAPVLVEIAQRRAVEARLDNAKFLLGDAQRYDLAGHSYDAVVSRFGVMFFDDPVAAFANIASAVRPEGALTCAIWRSPADNPFMAAAERVIADFAPSAGQPDPHAPGQFAFADADRVQSILMASGWEAIDIQPLDIPCAITADDLAVYARRMGRAGTVLPTLADSVRREAEARLDDAFAPFVTDGMAHFDAACWSVRSRKPVSN